jgi:hypothetical protein
MGILLRSDGGGGIRGFNCWCWGCRIFSFVSVSYVMDRVFVVFGRLGGKTSLEGILHSMSMAFCLIGLGGICLHIGAFG